MVATGSEETWIVGWTENVTGRRSAGLCLCAFLRATSASSGVTLMTLPTAFSLTESGILGVVLYVLWWSVAVVAVTMLQDAVTMKTSVASKHLYAQWTFHRLHRLLVHISAVKTTEQLMIITSAVINVVTAPNLTKNDYLICLSCLSSLIILSVHPYSQVSTLS